MSTIFQEEGGMACRAVNSIVVREFGGGKPIRPIVLHEVCVKSQVLFELLVNAFCLTVCLWMVGGGESCLNAK